MRRVFVTGGSGFIGSNLVAYLLEQQYEVVSYDECRPRDQRQCPFWVEGSVLDKERLNNAVKKFNPNFIIHLAARTDLDGGSVCEYPANVAGVANVIDTFKYCHSLNRVLFASSRLVCKIGYQPKADSDYCPTTPYGESKVEGEEIVRRRAGDIPCPWMIFRPTSIWGPWFGTPYKDFFMSILKSRYVHPNGKRIRKSFGYVGNSVYMLEKFINCDASLIDQRTMYLTDYPEIEVKDWAGMISLMAGKRVPLEVPLVFLKGAAAVGDTLKLLGFNNPPLTSFRLQNLLTEMLHDTADVENICGVLPYSVMAGIDETLSWIHEGL